MKIRIRSRHYQYVFPFGEKVNDSWGNFSGTVMDYSRVTNLISVYSKEIGDLAIDNLVLEEFEKELCCSDGGVSYESYARVAGIRKTGAVVSKYSSCGDSAFN